MMTTVNSLRVVRVYVTAAKKCDAEANYRSDLYAVCLVSNVFTVRYQRILRSKYMVVCVRV